MFSTKTTYNDNRKLYITSTSAISLLTLAWECVKNFEVILSLFSLTKPIEYTTMDILNLLMPLIVGGIIVGLIYLKYHSKDQKLKNEDFLKTLIEILDEERNYTRNTINNHVLGLKTSFIEPLKEIIKEPEIDKDKLIKLLNYKFDHHNTANGNSARIDELLSRLKLHKSNTIINEILYEKNSNLNENS